MENILKRIISKKTYDGIVEGTITDITFEMTPYWCKRVRGLGRACPYSLPFNNENRFCQRYGKACDSGKEIKFKKIELRQAKSDNVLTGDIETMKLEFIDDKLMLTINLSNFKQDE